MKNNTYIGIDYSGAATPEKRSSTIQVYSYCDKSGENDEPICVSSPSSKPGRRRNWNRIELSSWLIERLQQDDRCIVGMDHGFSFPISYFHRNKIDSWAWFLDDFVKHWPTHDQGKTVEQFRAGSSRAGETRELRLTEKWTSSAKSVFQFDVQGSVAKSTHAGLPFLHALRKAEPHVHFWPFDGWSFPIGQSIIFETYPSLFRNRYPRQSRSVDQQDAYSICRWLRDMDEIGRLEDFSMPPLTETQKDVASLEGWILGVY